MHEAIKLNETLQKEALEVIKVSHIEEILGKYGEVNYGGSYVYGTMVDRDIDIALIVNDQDDITIENRNKIASDLLEMNGCIDFSMSDRKNYPKRHRPNGIWFGTELLHRDEIWNMDIWMVTRNEPLIHTNDEMSQKLKNLNDEQRRVILEIKFHAMKNGIKKKGVTSAEIYKAVLYGNVTNFEEWEKYLKSS